MLNAERRELLDPPLIHAQALLKADTDESRGAAMAQLEGTVQAYERIAHVMGTPKLPELIDSITPELGRENTPTEEIAKNIFDENEALLVDKLEAQFKISTTRSILETLNEKSWAGKLVPGVASSLQQVLEIANANPAEAAFPSFRSARLPPPTKRRQCWPCRGSRSPRPSSPISPN